MNIRNQKLNNTVNFLDRLSINAALDLINIKSSDVSFNKSINGGLGLGIFITDNVQAAIFYDIQTVRQLRDYIISDYLGKPVPNATGYYNALDMTDNALFYNKTITGFSFKVIFSLANKKPV